MKKPFLFLTGFMFSIGMSAQEEAASSKIKLLERSASAPNTASLGKYFDIPVNMSTGIPNIQIPLYTIKSGTISLPIVLSYHASGIKVNTPASWVGLGWDISTGGVITKQVNGQDDIYSTTHYPSPDGIPAHSTYFEPDYTIDDDLGFTSMSDIIDSMQSGYAIYHVDELHRIMGRMILNRYDGESDEYHFKTPTGGGTIFYNQKIDSFQLNELNGWKTEYNSVDDEWYLTDNTGMYYEFTEKEQTTSPVYPQDADHGSIPSRYFTSAWYLTSINDFPNNRSVSFTYDVSGHKYYSTGASNVQNWSMVVGGPYYAGGNTTLNRRQGKEVNVRTITFPDGRIEFIKDTAARLDGGISALKHLKIYDRDSVLKKQINFAYFYAWSGTTNAARLFLKSVQEVDYTNESGAKSKPYVIHYDTTIAMPARFSYAQDIWGYNNGKTGNTTNIPTEQETQAYGLPAFADRKIDTNYTKAGIITQLVYPTGGSLNFIFENNRNDIDSLVGGLRIKKITNYDSVANKSIVTEYRYNDDNGHSTGEVIYTPKFHYFLDIGEYNTSHLRVTGEPIYPLYSNQGNPVVYGRVEKIEIGEGEELKTRSYFYNNLSGIDIPTNLTYTYIIGVPNNKFPDVLRFSNLLYKTEIYRKDNGEYKLLKIDSLGYRTLNQFKKYIWNAQAAWGKDIGVFTEWAGFDPFMFNPIDPYPSVNAYKMFQESLVTDVTKTRTIDEKNNQIEEIKYSKYDTINGNLKQLTTIASNGDTLRTYFSYPCDFISTSSGGSLNQEIKFLLDYNMISVPVEIVSTRKKSGGNEYVTDADLYLFTSGKLNKHLKIHDDGVLLSAISFAYNDNNGFYYDNRYTTESEVISYTSNGNPKELLLRSNTQSLIWDGDDILAIVTNASISNASATSFETSEKGGWTFSGVSSDTYSVTGSKSYQLSGGNITKSGLTSATYIVSYWGRSGSVNVNSVGPTRTGKTIGDWTYYEHEVTTTSITVSGSNYIDELRLYPKGALMKTYTYLPMLGMKSQCDVANRIIHYEYDGFGRLKLLRDEDGNIIKRIDYKYQQDFQQ